MASLGLLRYYYSALLVSLGLAGLGWAGSARACGLPDTKKLQTALSPLLLCGRRGIRVAVAFFAMGHSSALDMMLRAAATGMVCSSSRSSWCVWCMSSRRTTTERNEQLAGDDLSNQGGHAPIRFECASCGRLHHTPHHTTPQT